MNSKAVIFDLDGTVLDNEPIYGQAFNQVLRNLSIITNKKVPHTKGIGLKANWENLIKKYNIKTQKTPQELGQETQKAYKGLSKNVKLMPGFVPLAQDLKKKGIKLALATSNTREFTNTIYKKYNLARFFQIVVTGDDVTNSKPDPEAFLLTANLLRVDPADCLVFEDADAGIKAAHAAGMKAIKIKRPDTFQKIKLFKLDV